MDSVHQSLALLFMVLCPEDVSKVRLGKLTPHTYVRRGLCRPLRPEHVGCLTSVFVAYLTHWVIFLSCGSALRCCV